MRPCGQRRKRVRKDVEIDPPVVFPCSFAHTMRLLVTRFKPTLSWVGCQPSCCSPQSPVFPPPPPPPVSPLTLFGSFAGTNLMFDSSPAFMHGLCFWLPVPIRRLVSPDTGEVSRFSRVQFPDVLMALGLGGIS